MDKISSIGRWTPLTFLFPTRYINPDMQWEDFDFFEWSESEYDWEQDPWNGVKDIAKPPVETINTGEGDCEDYALVAASWAVATGQDGVGIALCWNPPKPWPTHAIAFDEDRVYSSGRTPEVTVDEWLEDSRYAFTLRRRIT